MATYNMNAEEICKCISKYVDISKLSADEKNDMVKSLVLIIFSSGDVPFQIDK